MLSKVRLVALAFALVSVVAAFGVWWVFGRNAAVHATPEVERPTVLFVVMDTVRADHTSVCGYRRPNTPTLEALVADGAQVSCGGVAPGSWTLPSHASYFTGLSVPEHGAHFAPASSEVVRQMHLLPLDEDAVTLAEQLADRGYQTVGVSGNPVLTPETGLSQGFEHWEVAAVFGDRYGTDLVDAVRRGLDQARPDAPLFLFVNIADAHDPWDGVPEGLDWVGPRDERVHYFANEDSELWRRFVMGEMSSGEASRTRSLVTDLYDHGVFRADTTLASVIALVARRGWAASGMRVVVVSDHGEFLGEHDLLRHGRYLWEPNNRVPLLVHHVGMQNPPPELPEQVSALAAYSLVLDGVVGEYPMYAAAYPDAPWMLRTEGELGSETSAAWWRDDGTKWLWMDGELSAYDLGRDPGERSGAEVEERDPDFDQFIEAVQESGNHQGQLDDDLRRALEAAGYLDAAP